MGIGLALVGNSRAKARQAGCLSNLKVIGRAQRLFSDGSDSRYVTSSPGNLSEGKDYVPGKSSLAECYAALGKELSSPKVLLCPVDQEGKTRDLSSVDFAGLTGQAISYFIGIEAIEEKFQMILSGDRNLCSDSDGNQLFPADGVRTNALKLTASWHRETIHGGRGNIGLADGSVRQADTKALLEILSKTGDSHNTVLLPKP